MESASETKKLNPVDNVVPNPPAKQEPPVQAPQADAALTRGIQPVRAQGNRVISLNPNKQGIPMSFPCSIMKSYQD